MEKEQFGSRLGFILVSAGCAIGLGNVWKFPYICGENGGAAFIVIYLACLAMLGLPMLICEYAVGRGSGKSVMKAYDVLQPEGTIWGKVKYFCFAGNYLLMKGDLSSSDILPLMIETFSFIASYEGEIPGASARDCGNYLLHDLPMARYEADKYLREVLLMAGEENLNYPL